MSYISAEDAADRVQEREDAIREASDKLDDGVSALCDVFNLPSVLSEDWGSRLASRIADQHEAHVSTVRQQMRLDSHNLRMFHARASMKPKDHGAESPSPPCDGTSQSRDAASSPPCDSSSQPSDAASSSGEACAAGLLVGLVVKALKNASKVDSLFKEFEDAQSTLPSGLLSIPDIILIRNSKPNLLNCRNRLQEDATKLKETFGTYKKCFYLLADQTELNKTLRAIRESTVPAEIFATPLAPAVADVLRLKRERDRAVEQASAIGEQLMTTWLSLPDARVMQEEYEAAIAQFDPLEALVSGQEAEHNSVMMFIVLMFETALNTPQSVPFSGGEVDVEHLLAAFDKYEKLTELSREMIEASEPIVETLTEFVAHLRAAARSVA